ISSSMHCRCTAGPTWCASRIPTMGPSNARRASVQTVWCCTTSNSKPSPNPEPRTALRPPRQGRCGFVRFVEGALVLNLLEFSMQRRPGFTQLAKLSVVTQAEADLLIADQTERDRRLAQPVQLKPQ